MRVAIVCSWLNQYGGAERVLEVVHGMFPDAPVYTSIYWPEALPASYRSWHIRTSFLDRLPLIKRHHQPFLPLYPFGFEALKLDGYDLVLSVTSAFAHGVTLPSHTIHVCYCLTPARFLWSFPAYARRERLGRLARAILPLMLPALRSWDLRAAGRVDHFVAISRAVQERISRCYRRPAEVIYPPVETSAFALSDEVDDYYLIVGRLVPYRRIDLAVQAFNALGLPLLIVGEGRDRPALERMAGPNVRFLGRVSDDERRRLLSRCRAFLWPGEEDFGIAPLEANASGRPVIAYRAGGAVETVVEGVTGAFFDEPTPEALAEAVRSLDAAAFDPLALRRHAERFDVSVFREEMRRFIAAAVGGAGPDDALGGDRRQGPPSGGGRGEGDLVPQ
ncbi:MAG: glycosyltransferase [Anaerolineae bacterium]|nr:glycosyltransferase [Anaerolineae bacterium]